MPVRFGAAIVQVVPFSLLRDDFVFPEAIGFDNAWVIDEFGIDWRRVLRIVGTQGWL